MKKIAFLLEALAAYLILWIINIFLFPKNIGFIGVSPHPYLFLVLLFACRYGYLKGLSGLIPALGGYLGVLLFGSTNPTYVELIPAGSFVIFHAIGGMIADDFARKLQKAEKQCKYLTKVSEDVDEEKRKIELRNEELSQRLLSERSTFAILYKVARKLNTLELDQIYPALIELLEEVLDANKSAIFLLEGRSLILKSSSVKDVISPSLLDQEILERVVSEKKTFSIKDVINKEGSIKDEIFLCAPIGAGKDGETKGIVIIWGLDFLKYNPTTLRIFSMLCDWASISLKNALLCKEGRGNKKPRDFTGIFPYGTGITEMEKMVNQL